MASKLYVNNAIISAMQYITAAGTSYEQQHLTLTCTLHSAVAWETQISFVSMALIVGRNYAEMSRSSLQHTSMQKMMLEKPSLIRKPTA